LAKCEASVVENSADAEMLEGASASEIDGELRSCADIFGTAGIETGEDHTPQVCGGCN
jgi:hypothetical protein